jgi:lipopolysaccharide export system protein LptA
MSGGGVAVRGVFAGLVFAVTAAGVSAAGAQTTQNVPNAVQGFSQNREAPVQIEALSLEVREKDKLATFTGEVNVVQGDTTMKCKSLVVFYDGESDKSGVNGSKSNMKAATPGPGGNQQIRRLEAKGGVIITQQDQTASGDSGIFDMKANTITLAGNVVVTQGPNVLRGDRLVVDMTNGVSRVESAKTADGRVRALIQPGSTPKLEAQAKPDAAKPDATKPDGSARTGSIKQEAQAKPDSRKPVPPRPLN